MKFSIIIPVYKVEKYLHECVDSVLNQNYKDFEIILVDDGSPDRCPQICDDYAARYATVRCLHQANGGQSSARNAGLSVASGEYVMFVDSDDYLINAEVLGLLAEKTEGEPDIVHYKNVEWFESDGHIEDCRFDYKVQTASKDIADVYCELIDKDAYYNSAWSKIIRRNLLTENGIGFESGILGEDNEWYYHVVMVAQTLVLVDEPLYVYRRRKNSITTTVTPKNLADQLYVIEKWVNITRDKGQDRRADVVRGSLAKQYCSALIICSHLSGAEKFLPKLREYKFLLEYTKTRRVVVFRKLVALLGIRGTIALLKVYNRIR